MNKCIFLDRDGVLNVDDVNYTYLLTKFRIIDGVPEALYQLKEAGYTLVVVTNQSGIDKGIYTQEQMKICHIYLQEACEHVIDRFYFCPYFRNKTASLARKPGTLMFEKAIAKFDIDIKKSWMIGDRGRDIVPARQLGIRTIQIGDEIPDQAERADYEVKSLLEAARFILKKKKA
ncbi:MAG: D,D-heptose 1,7-bisphosphate phosphatase [Azospira oryzae]|jgi:D-glycero-D-manno-heptose 1,7-bisphosphate phosphatase|nr:MAG: D,D-heptose 1,7-bisphosphate phosphatase [Azospira oryzae]